MRREARQAWLVLAACAGLGFTVYANSLSVPFYLDDLRNFIDTPQARLHDLSPTSLWRAAFGGPIWTRPVANLSFALNYYAHQEAVTGYHLVNTTIHVLAAFFVFLLTRSLLATPALAARGLEHALLPPAAALLWLVHPLHTQSVTYIVQRMNSLAVLLYLISFWAFVRGRLAAGAPRQWRWFALCGLAGLFALGSKEIAVTLPFFLLLVEIFFFRNLDRRWLLGLLLALILLATGFALTLAVAVDDPLSLLTSYARRPYTPVERVLTEWRVVLWYLGLLFFPHPGRLSLDHDFPLSLSLFTPPATFLSLLAITGLLGLAAVIARRERLLPFAVFWYFGNLALESSLLDLELVFEHRTYLPSVFVAVAVIDWWLRLIRSRWLAVGAIVLAIMLLSSWTIARNRLWQDPVSFWEDGAAKAPAKARPFINLSAAYRERKDYARAIDAAQTAIRLDPRFVNGFFALGTAYLEMGDLDRAIAAYQETLRRMPEYAEVYNALAGAYLRKGLLPEAAAALQENLRLDPKNFRALVNMASLKAYQGRYPEAIADFERALEVGGDSPDVLFNLALAYDRSGNPARAIATYERLLRLQPGDAQARRNLEQLRGQAIPAR